MFLSLGGSRRSNSGSSRNRWGALLKESGSPRKFEQAGLSRPLERLQHAEGDPLGALASGKYASSFRENQPQFQHKKLTCSPSLCDDPVLNPPIASPLQSFTPAESPGSTLPPLLDSLSLPSFSWETGLISDNGSLQKGGSSAGEEVLSRDWARFETGRKSQTLVMVKKIKDTLGNKFADCLKETIKEVVKREKFEDEGNDGDNAWPRLTESLETSPSGRKEGQFRLRSGVAGNTWDGFNDDGSSSVISGHPIASTSLLGRQGSSSFSSMNNLPFEPSFVSLQGAPSTSEDSLKGRLADHSKGLTSWPPHQNPARARRAVVADFTWDAASRAQDAKLSSSQHSSLLESNDGSMIDFSELLKEGIESRSGTSRGGGMRKHVFPEAAAMGMRRPVSIPKRGDPSSRSKPSSSDLYNSINNVNEEDSFLDVLNLPAIKGLQSSDKECGLSYLNNLRQTTEVKAELGLLKFPDRPSNMTLQGDSRQCLFDKPAVSSSESTRKALWQGGHEETGNASTSYNPVAMLQLPGIDLCNSGEGGSKRTHGETSPSSQLSKRQCIGLNPLDIPATIDDDGENSIVGFEQYYATLIASERVPSYELGTSLLANLL